jgi:hypothetical protein
MPLQKQRMSDYIFYIMHKVEHPKTKKKRMAIKDSHEMKTTLLRNNKLSIF